MNPIVLPSSLLAEHDTLRQMLQNAEQLPGKTGAAARQLARLFRRHAAKEEQYVFPLLALLPVLSDKKFTPDMVLADELEQKLRNEAAGMLEEHRQIVAGLKAFSRVALKEHHPVIAHFANKLMLHTQMEEEIVYPAAILAAEYLKMQLEGKTLSAGTNS